MRPGALALLLPSSSLKLALLEALDAGPMSLAALRRALDSPPTTTMRAQLAELVAKGVISRTREARFPRAATFGLNSSGRTLLGVGGSLMDWLATAPDGPLRADSEAGAQAVKALAEGWGTGIVAALAARPRSLTQLSQTVTSTNYPSFERRLSALRRAGLVEPAEAPGIGTPYAPTSWLRRAIAPIYSAIRWERQCISDALPVTAVDAEACFLLALPLTALPPTTSGQATLAVRLSTEKPTEVGGVTVSVEHGKVASCVPGIAPEPRTWALGTPDDWLDAVIDGSLSRMRIGGRRPQLVLDVIAGLSQVVAPKSMITRNG